MTSRPGRLRTPPTSSHVAVRGVLYDRRPSARTGGQTLPRSPGRTALYVSRRSGRTASGRFGRSQRVLARGDGRRFFGERFSDVGGNGRVCDRTRGGGTLPDASACEADRRRRPRGDGEALGQYAGGLSQGVRASGGNRALPRRTPARPSKAACLAQGGRTGPSGTTRPGVLGMRSRTRCGPGAPSQTRTIRCGRKEKSRRSSRFGVSTFREPIFATRERTFVRTTENGKRANHTLGIASLGGATGGVEEDYLLVELLTSCGVISVENQARI